MRPLRFSVVVLLLAALPNLLSAQDFHYSQFYNAPLHLNPALTGVFNGDVRFMGNYKSQWTNVPVDYKTVTLAIDKRLQRSIEDDGFFAIGAAFNYDRSGDSKLTWANLDLNASYTKMFSEQVLLSLGGKAALVQRGFDDGNLNFDSQYNQVRGRFEPSLPTGENFSTDSNLFPDFSLGVNLRLQAKQTDNMVFRNNRRTALDVGVALHHLTGPDQTFFEEKVPLERRLSPYAMGTLQLLPAVDLVGAVTYQNQGPFYDELVGMLAGKLWIKNDLGSRFSIMGGMGLRRDAIQDAYWPTFEIGYNNLNVGLNYDFNTSDFDIATENRGGWEFSVRYIIRKVPLRAAKTCPFI